MSDYNTNYEPAERSEWWYDQDYAMTQYCPSESEDDHRSQMMTEEERSLQMCVYNNSVIQHIFFKGA